MMSCCKFSGGFFDPLNLAGGDDADKVFRLKTAEIKHARLAMVAFAGEFDGAAVALVGQGIRCAACD